MSPDDQHEVVHSSALPEAAGAQLTGVILAHQCSRFLSAAIDSMLHVRRELRRILVAYDPCADDTLAVARSWRERYADRIEVLENSTRLGAAGNLNRAVQHVDTPYFVKLDGDDLVMRTFIEIAVALMEPHPRLSVVSGKEIRISAEDFLEYNAAAAVDICGGSVSVLSGVPAFEFAIRWRPNPCSSGSVFRTHSFRSVGGCDEALTWGEDWELWLRLARSWSVAYVDAPCALYRIHDGSTTAVQAGANRICYGYDQVFRRAAELCPDPALKPLLRRSFLKTAKTYFGSAKRSAAQGQPLRQSLDCVRRGIAAAAHAFSV